MQQRFFPLLVREVNQLSEKQPNSDKDALAFAFIGHPPSFETYYSCMKKPKEQDKKSLPLSRIPENTLGQDCAFELLGVQKDAAMNFLKMKNFEKTKFDEKSHTIANYTSCVTLMFFYSMALNTLPVMLGMNTTAPVADLSSCENYRTQMDFDLPYEKISKLALEAAEMQHKEWKKEKYEPCREIISDFQSHPEAASIHTVLQLRECTTEHGPSSKTYLPLKKCFEENGSFEQCQAHLEKFWKAQEKRACKKAELLRPHLL